MSELPELKQGDDAPEVEFETDRRHRLRLSTLRGHKVVLYFYPKDDTPGCTTEALGFAARKADFEAAGARILGISKDSPDSHVKFKAKHGFDLDLATPLDDEGLHAFGTWVEKSMYGRKYMGIDRATFLIDRDGKVARVWRKVKVPGHVDEVLKAVQALA